MFTLEDTIHCTLEKYDTFELALEAVQRRAQIPWHEEPNQAPCTSWRTCGRSYIIGEFDETTNPWTTLKITPILEIDAKGVRWEPEFEPQE